jgi:hypothetical protein
MEGKDSQMVPSASQQLPYVFWTFDTDTGVQFFWRCSCNRVTTVTREQALARDFQCPKCDSISYDEGGN